MASRRRIRRCSCQHKVRYPNRSIARAAIWHQRHKWIGHMSAYLCAWCRGWHIGHTPKH